MKSKKIFFQFAAVAILLTSFGYLIDTDPPYADFKMTVIEFSIITTALFSLFSIFHFVGKLIKKLLKPLTL